MFCHHILLRSCRPVLWNLSACTATALVYDHLVRTISQSGPCLPTAETPPSSAQQLAACTSSHNPTFANRSLSFRTGSPSSTC